MISIPIIFRLAVSTLVENRMRSTLTLTGMVFGTAAVIATLSSNAGAQKFIASQMQDLGTKLVTITSASAIVEKDTSFLKKYVSDIDLTVRENNLGPANMRYRNLTSQGDLVAVDPNYFGAMGLTLATGRQLIDQEYETGEFNAIVGDKVRQQLFGQNSSFFGEMITIQINSVMTKVSIIGAFKEKGGTGNSFLDNAIFVSTKAGTKLKGTANTPRIIVQLVNQEKSGDVKRKINTLLAPRHFERLTVTDARETIEKTQEIWSKQNFVGICLACISLITGGVGIMNIMLLSIHQRQKEIGLRKAVGAQNSEIALQFLLEAVLICLIGGIIGILIGWAFGQQVAKMLGNWEAETSLNSILLAICFSVLTGIVFGLLPAIRASRIDPYDTLRIG